MNKWIIIFIVLFFSIFIFTFKMQGDHMVGLGVFNKEVWVKKDFDKIIMHEAKRIQSMAPIKSDNHDVVGINIELPDDTLSDSIVQVRSLIMADYVYSGPYKKVITILANEGMLKSKESPKFDGVDILTITFIDVKRRLTYTCTQEKLDKIWERNKIATIHFLESRKLDEDGLSLCYSASISGYL